MLTFKQFLVENIYPGGYYDAYGNLKVHFDNAEEKKKFDDDPRNDARSDDWHYERDKEHENMEKRVDTAKKVDNKVTKAIKSVQGASNDLIGHINKEVFGDSYIADKAVDSIKNINELNNEIEINRNIIFKINKMIQNSKNKEHKEYLKKLKIQRVLRQQDLLKKKKEYEDRYYN